MSPNETSGFTLVDLFLWKPFDLKRFDLCFLFQDRWVVVERCELGETVDVRIVPLVRRLFNTSAAGQWAEDRKMYVPPTKPLVHPDLEVSTSV